MNDNKEAEMKQFVIMEVRRSNIPLDGRDGMERYVPIDGGHEGIGDDEALWLKPSRVIDGDRLRYGCIPEARQGDIMFFSTAKPGWDNVAWTGSGENAVRLILDPLPEPKSTWQQWVDDCPAIPSDCMPKFKEWLERMPKRE